MKILLPIDNSPESTRALDEVRRGPWPSDAEILVLAVAPRRFLPPPPPSMLEVLDGGWRERPDETARVRVSVQLAVEALKTSGLAARGKVRRGHPAAEIAEEARAWGADSILLAPTAVARRAAAATTKARARPVSLMRTSA